MKNSLEILDELIDNQSICDNCDNKKMIFLSYGMIDKILNINKSGITIKELKELIKDLPEINKNGDQFEVWIGSKNGLSNIVIEISALNKTQNGFDIILLNE